MSDVTRAGHCQLHAAVLNKISGCQIEGSFFLMNGRLGCSHLSNSHIANLKVIRENIVSSARYVRDLTFKFKRLSVSVKIFLSRTFGVKL